jgi:hypothetical protein
MPSASEVRARADVNQRIQGASASATTTAKSAYQPQHYFRERNYSGEISGRPKLLIGMGMLVAVVIAIGYLFVTSKPAPPLNTATRSSQSPSVAPQAVVETPSNDEEVAVLPTVAPTTAPAPPVESVASAPDMANSAPVSQPLAAAPSLTTETRVQPMISFAVDPVVVEQGDSVARIVVHRSGSTRREWSVPWRTLEGSAKSERDFVATSDGVLLFSPGARDAVILVPIVKDSTRQHSDWFEVEVMIDSTVTANTAQDSALRATIVIATAQAAGKGDDVSPSAGPNGAPSTAPSTAPSNESGVAPDTT